MALELPVDNWRKEIVDYLEDPSKKVSRRIRFQATKYVLLEGSYITERLMEFCTDALTRKKLRS